MLNKYFARAAVIAAAVFCSLSLTSQAFAAKAEVITTEGDTIEVETRQRPEVPVRFGVLGNMLFSNPASMAGRNNDIALGAGGVLQLPVGGKVHFEPGLFYLNRSWQKTNTTAFGQTADTTYTNTLLQAPVMLRVWPVPFASFGLGGYYSRYISKVNASADIGGSTRTRTMSNADLGIGLDDWGLVASLGFDIPMSKTFGVLAEARATQSLSTPNNPVNNWGSRDVQALLGLRVAMSALE